jgi:ABC-type multidrug transport system ATPase subunit
MAPQEDQATAEEIATGPKGRDFPLVELELDSIIYRPVTTSGGEGNGATKKRTTVLDKISTRISPFKLTAWMGPSGSGKSSLISVAAGLTRSGDLADTSIVSVNGEVGRIPKRLVGVVWQDDLLLSNLTVEENIYFSARLKTSEETPDAVVHQVVEDTIEELGLVQVRNSLVGGPQASVRGVSGGERKRVSVAVELVVRPSVLFLDEPTSGLDATTAQALISTLKDLAARGHSIAVVIHQPRTAIYNQFDHLLLLSRGRVLYDGEPCKARLYLESCPTVTDLPPETGIADWIMDIVTEDERRQDGSALVQKWAECSESAECTSNVEASSTVRAIERMSSLKELHSSPKFSTSFLKQFHLLTKRTLKQQRGERLTALAVIVQLSYLFFTALFWWRLPDTTGFIFERNSLLFFIIVAQANGVVINAVTVFQRESKHTN